MQNRTKNRFFFPKQELAVLYDKQHKYNTIT